MFGRKKKQSTSGKVANRTTKTVTRFVPCIELPNGKQLAAGHTSVKETENYLEELLFESKERAQGSAEKLAKTYKQIYGVEAKPLVRTRRNVDISYLEKTPSNNSKPKKAVAKKPTVKTSAAKKTAKITTKKKSTVKKSKKKK